MTLYDATMPLTPNTVVFPGDPEFKMEPVFRCSAGDAFNLSLLSIHTHLGTHVDPPSHFFDGSATADQLALDVLVGPAIVLDMRGVVQIDRPALEAADVDGHLRVLFKTDNGRKLLDPFFHEKFVSLTEDAAHYLVEKGVRLVGIDYLSIEQYDSPDETVHRTLLAGGVLVVEGVLLADVPSGPCRVYCLPLKIAGGDGAPARVLVESDQSE
jgi:arylformamidase